MSMARAITNTNTIFLLLERGDMSSSGLTPGVLIGNDKLGYTKVSGAKPYQSFQTVLDEVLAK